MRWVWTMLVLGACPATQAPDEPASVVAVPTQEPEPAVPPGPLWMALADGGIVRLDANGFTRVPGRPSSADALAVGSDGSAWVAGDEALFHAEGDRLSHLTAIGGKAEALDVGADGTVLVVTSGGVGTWAGGAWTSVKGPGPFLGGGALAPDGTIWAVSQHHAHHWDGTAWTDHDLRLVDPTLEFTDEVVVHPDAGVWVNGIGDGYVAFRFDGTTWSKAPSRAGFGGDERNLRRHVDGTIRALGRDVTLFVEHGEGTTVSAKTAGFHAFDATDAVVDLAGRTWFATGSALIMSPDGTSSVVYPPSSETVLTTPPRWLAVHAGGPPAPPPKPVTGTVTGRLTVGGAPLANGRVQLCDGGSFMFQDTPCERIRPRGEGTTDADGRFSLSDVPWGRQTLHYATAAGEWTQLMGVVCCAELRQGATLDLGELAASGD